MTEALEGGEWSPARPGRTLQPGKDTVPILQEAGWAPGPVWTGGKTRLQRDSIPDRPVSIQTLYQLNYPAHKSNKVELHLSGLIETASHPDKQKIWVIEFIFDNRLHWQFEVRLLLFTIRTCV